MLPRPLVQCLASARQVTLLAVFTALSGGCGRVGYDQFNGVTLGTSDGSGGDGAGSSGGNGTSDAASGFDSGTTGGGTTSSGGSPSGDGGPTRSGGATGSGGSASGDGGACVVTNGGVETCDGLDNDCNGVADDGAVCGSQCIGATYGGHAYAFCSSALNFADAASACQSKSMRLTRVDDASEDQFLGSLAFAAVGTQNTVSIWPWLGAQDSASPVQWTFMDGAVFWSGTKSGSRVGGLYSNWASASPGDATGTSCAALQHVTAGTWVDRRCTELHPYLCEAY